MDPRLMPYVDALANAYRTSSLLPQFPEGSGPVDLSEAYTVQEAVSAMCGLKSGGWKVGCTSFASQRKLGSDGPIAGRVFANRIFRSGITLKDVRMDMLLVEAEFAFRLTADLPSRKKNYERDEVVAAVGSLYPAIELVQSRFAESRVPIIDLVADNAGAGSLVLGAECINWRDLDLQDQAVTLTGPNGMIAQGRGSDVLGHPLNALIWLTNFLSRRDFGLKAGEIVTTGTCFAPPMLQPDIEITADFGLFGHTHVRFERSHQR